MYFGNEINFILFYLKNRVDNNFIPNLELTFASFVHGCIYT